VSRAFTPGASVSKEVRQRILHAAEHLGYRVNRLAQSLNNARSNLIGLVGTDLQQPFHAELLATLSAALLADGFQCMLLNAANAERDIGALIARVLEYRVSAIVVMSGTPTSRIVEECLRNGVPVILVNKLLPNLAVDTVIAPPRRGWEG
jgi:DNA-binding LacI/PurR family transcriptional regulator